MRDNKLSELSKPVAWKLHHHDRYYFEENADVVAIAESFGQAKVDAVYSQEYVSALLAELEGIAQTLNVANDATRIWKERALAAEHRLAKPVRLPDVLFIKVCGSAVPVMHATRVKEQVHAAGFTVEGDE